jgi:hypothetical protein
MVITILQAEVAPDKVEALETAYREAIVRLDAGMVRTFLLRDARARRRRGRSSRCGRAPRRWRRCDRAA